jgi:hypothetical protein
MSENDQVIEALLDFANALESACVNLKHYIAKLKGVQPQHEWTWNPDKLNWQQVEGQKGPFEKCSDTHSLDYQNMVADLKQHGGRLTRDQHFYWLFQDGTAVGRKPRKYP